MADNELDVDVNLDLVNDSQHDAQDSLGIGNWQLLIAHFFINFSTME